MNRALTEVDSLVFNSKTLNKNLLQNSLINTFQTIDNKT